MRATSVEVICDAEALSLDLRERVVSYVEAGHSRRAAAGHFRVSPSFVINLMTAFRERGRGAPKALGGWRHSKLDPHRVFLLRRVAEKDGVSMQDWPANPGRQRRESRPCLSVALADPQRSLLRRFAFRRSGWDRPDVGQARKAWRLTQPQLQTQPRGAVPRRRR